MVKAGVSCPPGYKQTEVGVIPEDWEVRPLSSIVTFLDGQRKPVKDADRAKMRGTIPYYGASGIVDYVNDYLFDEELILLGEDGENILSRNTRLAFRISGKTWVNNHAHVLRPNPDINIGFLTDYLESLNYERINSGTAQPKLNKQNCMGILISLPPTLAEQEAIAAALGDADALIESLEQLIAKKRLVKQGAMQELLTGRRRLPGFSGDIIQKALGSICVIEKGEQLNRDTLLPTGDYPVWNGGITPSGFTDKWNTDACMITVSEGGNSCGFVNYIQQKFWRGGHCYALKNIENPVSKDYLFQFLKHREKEIMALRVGSGLPNIQRARLSTFEILLPSFAEQTAIAEALGAMDAEIDALEAKLSKARLVKQGMMQELLTGRVRLV